MTSKGFSWDSGKLAEGQAELASIFVFLDEKEINNSKFWVFLFFHFFEASVTIEEVMVGDCGFDIRAELRSNSRPLPTSWKIMETLTNPFKAQLSLV